MQITGYQFIKGKKDHVLQMIYALKKRPKPMFRTYFHFSSFAPRLLSPFSKTDKLELLNNAATSKDSFRIEIINSMAQLEALEQDWNEIFARSANNDQPFLSFNWHWHWCKHYLEAKNDNHSLQVITLWDQDKLIMLWPMQVKSFGGRKHLHFMGDPVSQYGDVLCDQSYKSAALLDQVWTYIKQKQSYDLVILRKVKTDATISPLIKKLDAIQTAAEAGFYLDLSSFKTSEQYQTRFKRKERKNRARKFKRLAQSGQVKITHYTESKQAALLAKQAIVMKRKWLEEKGLLSKAFNDKTMEDFFASIAASSDRAIGLCLSALSVDDKIAAITISFAVKGNRVMHINVIDTDFEKNSPGVSLLEQAIAHSIEKQDKIIDFLAPADPYKEIWCNKSQNINDFALPLNLSGKVYSLVILKWIRQNGKILLHFIPSKLQHKISQLLSKVLWR